MVLIAPVPGHYLPFTFKSVDVRGVTKLQREGPVRVHSIIICTERADEVSFHREGCEQSSQSYMTKLALYMYAAEVVHQPALICD